MWLIDEYIRQNVQNPRYSKVMYLASNNTGFVDRIFQNENVKLIVGFSLIIHTPAANTAVQFFDNFNNLVIDHPANSLMQQVGTFYYFWPENRVALRATNPAYEFTLGFQCIYQNSEPVKTPKD